ncbi:curli production assembly/transport component CsgG [bacterium BMS3Abin10]|nr:curli production assembly/transport component CsgG [bacterium BMS3Abin10]GBE39722.1 curli production assembly/transport component CsgG [bacterium BMS3Bbin08]
MKSAIKKVLPVLMVFTAFLFVGCMEQYAQPTAKVDPGISAELPPYYGPKARVTVAKFQWKAGGAGGGTTTISGMGRRDVVITHENAGAMTGLRDMLTTALVQSGRYRVLERQELSSIKSEIALGEEGYAEKSSSVKKGKIKGADLMVIAAITGWSPGSSGGRAGIGGIGGGIIGGIMGGIRKSSLAMDIRIIDTSTSEVLAATRVEGTARDVNMGFLAGGIIGDVGLGGGLSMYAKTPMEKAIRKVINEATKYIVSATPPEYFKH